MKSFGRHLKKLANFAVDARRAVVNAARVVVNAAGVALRTVLTIPKPSTLEDYLIAVVDFVWDASVRTRAAVHHWNAVGKVLWAIFTLPSFKGRLLDVPVLGLFLLMVNAVMWVTSYCLACLWCLYFHKPLWHAIYLGWLGVCAMFVALLLASMISLI